MWKNEVFINVHDVELNKFPISKQLMNSLFYTSGLRLWQFINKNKKSSDSKRCLPPVTEFGSTYTWATLDRINQHPNHGSRRDSNSHPKLGSERLIHYANPPHFSAFQVPPSPPPVRTSFMNGPYGRLILSKGLLSDSQKCSASSVDPR